MSNEIKNRLEVVILPRPSTVEAIMYWGMCLEIRSNSISTQVAKRRLSSWKLRYDKTSWLYTKLDELEQLVDKVNPNGEGKG